MHREPIPPPWYSSAHTVQRTVLLELLLAPVAEPDRITTLAARGNAARVRSIRAFSVLSLSACANSQSARSKWVE